MHSWPSPPKNPVKFEESLEQLSTLVQQLESGQLSLEDSVNIFEKGISLTRECQNALSEAEQKVELLLQEPENKEKHEATED